MIRMTLHCFFPPAADASWRGVSAELWWPFLRAVPSTSAPTSNKSWKGKQSSFNMIVLQWQFVMLTYYRSELEMPFLKVIFKMNINNIRYY